MSSKKKVIDKEFKLNAVKYKEEHPDLTCDEVASNLGISTSSLYRWVNAYASADADYPVHDPGGAESPGRI